MDPIKLEKRKGSLAKILIWEQRISRQIPSPTSPVQRVENNNPDISLCSSLLSLNIKNNQWKQIDIKNENKPPRLKYHNCVVFNNSMYFFGGFDGFRCNSIYEFNFESQKWINIKLQGDIPSYRQESV